MKGHPIFAALYDLEVWPRRWSALWRRRVAVAGAAEGRVLDLGAGNGLNFACCGRAGAIVGLEPDPYMLCRAVPRRAVAAARAALIQARGEALPLADATFDTVLATLVLCTVEDPAATLREVRRVLRPGGALRFLEHVRAPSPRLAAFQDRVQPLWSRLFAGCRPNRETLALIRAAGFTVEALEITRRGLLIQGLARPSPPLRATEGARREGVTGGGRARADGEGR